LCKLTFLSFSQNFVEKFDMKSSLEMLLTAFFKR
jgi:hypothetical protein